MKCLDFPILLKSSEKRMSDGRWHAPTFVNPLLLLAVTSLSISIIISTSSSAIIFILLLSLTLAQYAHNGHMGIWAYVKKYGQVGYPRKEHQKCSSGMLTSGP